MKTTMKKPESIRNGFKLAGLFAVVLMALCVAVGADADSGLIYGATGVATVGAGEGVISGQEVSTETAKDASKDILEDSVSTRITEVFKDQATLLYLLDKVSKERMNTTNGTFSRVHRFYQVGQRPVEDVVLEAYDNIAPGLGHALKEDETAAIKVGKAPIWTKDSVIYPHNPDGSPLGAG
jgi:hypothetical protein